MLHDVVLPGLPLPPERATCPGCARLIGGVREQGLDVLEGLYAEAVAGSEARLRAHLTKYDVPVDHPAKCPARSLHSGILIHCVTSAQAREWHIKVRTKLPELPPPAPPTPPGPTIGGLGI